MTLSTRFFFCGHCQSLRSPRSLAPGAIQACAAATTNCMSQTSTEQNNAGSQTKNDPQPQAQIAGIGDAPEQTAPDQINAGLIRYPQAVCTPPNPYPCSRHALSVSAMRLCFRRYCSVRQVRAPPSALCPVDPLSVAVECCHRSCLFACSCFPHPTLHHITTTSRPSAHRPS
jgi:hypothetical protein